MLKDKSLTQETAVCVLHTTMIFFKAASVRDNLFLFPEYFFTGLCGIIGDQSRRAAVINLINWFWDVNQMNLVPVGAWGQTSGEPLLQTDCPCPLWTILFW